MPPEIVPDAALPFNVIVDREGLVRYRGLTFDEKALHQTIEGLLGGAAARSGA